MNIPSIKKQIITHFCGLTQTDLLKGNKLILLTAFGIVSGELIFDVPDDSSEDINNKVLSNIIKRISDDYCADYSIELPTNGNDGCFLLKNVEILSSSTSQKSISLAQLVVFFDQIIGVSVGNIGAINTNN